MKLYCLKLKPAIIKVVMGPVNKYGKSVGDSDRKEAMQAFWINCLSCTVNGYDSTMLSSY
jgi:hypothetical protein